MARKSLRLIDLNPPQREAVKHLEGPLLLLAGAGSGKTRVVTNRIAYMMTQDIKASEILAVTFTNKAANEMRERVSSMITKKQAEDVWVSTFHSLCVKILHSGIHKLGYNKNFTIYTAGDQLGLIRKIIVRKIGKNEKAEPNRIQSLISRFKSKGIPVSDEEDSLESHVFREYQRELKKLNAVDFDDLLLFAVKLLEEYDDIRDFWSRRFNYIMVDEFQDTNKTQMDLVRALARRHQNICVVGDDDQSIYGWRGAEIANILNFERFFKSPKVIKLEQNYRSTTPILELANGLIKFNAGRREKRLWTEKKSAAPVRLIGMPSDREEAETIAQEILDDGEKGRGRPYEDFAVLFRMNSQSRAVEEQMRALEIPYRVIGGQSFFDRREVKDILGYIALLANKNDDIALLRIANYPARGISDTTMEMAAEHSVDKQQPIFITFEDPEFTQLLSNKAQEKIGNFVEMIDRYRELAGQPLADLGALVQELVREIDFIKAMKRTCRTDEERASRESNVRELVESVYRFTDDRRGKKKDATLTGFMTAMMLDDSKRDTGDDIEKQKGVSLITLHASKGLEFPVVFLVGLEEGILPHSRSIEEDTKPEERRLLYVGITRAMEQLTLSYCQTRMRFGQLSGCQPSSFIQELNPEHMEITTLAQLEEVPATEEETKSFFGMMKDKIAG